MITRPTLLLVQIPIMVVASVFSITYHVNYSRMAHFLNISIGNKIMSSFFSGIMVCWPNKFWKCCILQFPLWRFIVHITFNSSEKFCQKETKLKLFYLMCFIFFGSCNITIPQVYILFNLHHHSKIIKWPQSLLVIKIITRKKKVSIQK